MGLPTKHQFREHDNHINVHQIRYEFKGSFMEDLKHCVMRYNINATGNQPKYIYFLWWLQLSSFEM